MRGSFEKVLGFFTSFFILLVFSAISLAQEPLPELPIIFQLETEITIRDLDWNFDSSLLAFVDGYQDVTIIHVETGEIDLRLHQTESERLAGKSIAWSPTQNYLLIVNNSTKLWNYDENTLVDDFEFPAAISEDYTPVGNADWHPTQEFFAIVLFSCAEGTPYRPGARVELWDVTTSTYTQIADCLWTSFNRVKWNPQGTQLAISGFAIFDEDGLFVESEEIEIWDMDTQKRVLTIGELKSPSGLDWSPGGDLIAFTTVIDLNQFIQVRDVTSGEIVSQAGGDFLAVYVPLDWHPAEKLIVTGGQDGSVRIWDALSGLELIELPVHEDTVNDVSWSPDGSMLASVGRDGRLFIWDVSELRQLGE